MASSYLSLEFPSFQNNPLSDCFVLFNLMALVHCHRQQLCFGFCLRGHCVTVLSLLHAGVSQECPFPPGGLLLPHQGYAPAPLWGMTRPPHHHHQNQPFYGAAGTFPGAARHQPPAALPIGSHNQFIPLQVGLHVSGGSRNTFLFCCFDGVLFLFLLFVFCFYADPVMPQSW